MKKGLLYSVTSNESDYYYSSHEFGINLITGKVMITTRGKAFDSCHYMVDTDSEGEYGSCKKSVSEMYVMFTKDGQYYGRFYVYTTINEHDIIDGAYINNQHTDFKNKNEPRLSTLIYSHNHNIKRNNVKKGNSSVTYEGQGYANPANGYAYYYSLINGITGKQDNELKDYSLEIVNRESNGNECAECNCIYDDDCMYYIERNDIYLCEDCVSFCHGCEEYFNGNNETCYELNGDIYCNQCINER